MADRHALYRFYSMYDQLLYIGITLDPSVRWKSHREDKPWWHEVARITIEHHANRRGALDAECAAIIAERPLHNIIHNPVRKLTVGELTYGRGWGSRAEDMPDICHDYCAQVNIFETYFPYEWSGGLAHYRCHQGHDWTCGWGHYFAGRAPWLAGLSQSQDASICGDL